VLPPTRSYLEELSGRGIPVHAVGKTHDLFAGVGFTARHPGATNAAALAETTRLIRDELDRGLVFTNLIETDQRYGHRKDVHGFHRALQGIDEAVAGWLDLLRPGTCSCSPPTTAWTPRRRTRTTRASTRRSWRSSRATRAAPTTGRWPTWAPRAWPGSRGRRRGGRAAGR
jgi:hypothetical protein